MAEAAILKNPKIAIFRQWFERSARKFFFEYSEILVEYHRFYPLPLVFGACDGGAPVGISPMYSA